MQRLRQFFLTTVKYPISTDPETGTTKCQPEETVREQYHRELLEEYDLECAKKKTGKVIAELKRGTCRARTDDFMERHTRRVRKEVETDLQKN